MQLVDALARFNRKERYWVVHNALGKGAMSLSPEFRERLGKEIDLEIPQEAWWAMDYHLDWLVGAFRVIDKGENNRSQVSNDKELIRGNQQDIDLVIAFKETLILIEAKGVTGWSNQQFREKLKRLEEILAHQNDTHGFVPQLFLAQLSPRRPRTSPEPDNNGTNAKWPPWMVKTDGRPYWISLAMKLRCNKIVFEDNIFLTAVRCDAVDDRSNKKKDHWKISHQKITVTE